MTGESEIVSVDAPPTDFGQYVESVVHLRARTLTALGFTLIPVFFLLDVFMMPSQLLVRFAFYRLGATVLIFGQHLFIRLTSPTRYSILHGYAFTVIAAGMVAVMTTDLGGLNSTYYAGLNLVMIAVNALLPWRSVHSAVNCLIIIGLYLLTNLAWPSSEPISQVALINNGYFLVSTAIISTAANTMSERLVKEEFRVRTELRTARDALWGDMAVAKRIQTSLLPRARQLPGYQLAATMRPAEEVGGDYYDVIETRDGEVWIAIGDVSGHGVESGLIMMMTQTSIFTAVSNGQGLLPSRMLERVNGVLSENISRLGADRYMSISALALRGDEVVFSGKHQDILVYRRAQGLIEVVPTTGTWLGVLHDLRGKLKDATLQLEDGDVVLLFTDGVTEATNAAGEMYGEEELERALHHYAELEVDAIVRNIAREVQQHMARLDDDFTLVALKRVGRPLVEGSVN
jgi:sigma-B regulation protein RsbU (phosphoserine phosphatase)